MSWDIQYNTHQNMICHKFSQRIEMTTDLNCGTIRIFKDGKEVSKFDGSEMTITEYERLIIRTYNEAKTLPVLI